MYDLLKNMDNYLAFVAFLTPSKQAISRAPSALPMLCLAGAPDSNPVRDVW